MKDVDATAELIIATHVRMDSRDCLCGFNKLGASHAMHVVEKLREAGLLKDENTEDLQALFDLQWKRSREADEFWRAEDPVARANTWPDLGVLLEWLMKKAGLKQ